MTRTAQAPASGPRPGLAQSTGERAADAQRPLTVAYIVSRFPKLTETFILYEMAALEKQGVHIELYPLLRARSGGVHPEGASLFKKLAERLSGSGSAPLMHAEAAPYVARAHYHPFLSWPILRAQLFWLLRRPLAYWSALWTVARATWGSPNFFFGSLAIFPKAAFIARQIKQSGVVHVHAHFANHPAAAAFVVHRLAEVPFSFTAHGADLQVDQHLLREKVAEAAFVVTISEHNRQFMAAVCGEASAAKVRVLHCGVDTETFRPAVTPRARPGKRPVILCIGTLYAVKGHRYLIESARLLSERGLAFDIYLVGEGPFREALTTQTQTAGLNDSVHFLGPKTRPEIIALLGQAAVLAVPSIRTPEGRREGIPVVLMEAMASGLPVVASRISGIPELVEHEHSGLLVPPADPLALADALERVIGDTALRQRLIRGGREKVQREFDLAANATALAAMFAGGGA